jgi:hypothetical protein
MILKFLRSIVPPFVALTAVLRLCASHDQAHRASDHAADQCVCAAHAAQQCAGTDSHCDGPGARVGFVADEGYAAAS